MITTSKKILGLLRAYESQNVTFIDPDGSWPIVWDRAKGVHVWDLEARKYLDLTAAFGVAACGHANPRVIKAGKKQMGRLLHAMGDVHPHALKAKLAQELSRLTFERWSNARHAASDLKKPALGKTIFCNSGFEAVEAALKTALLATGKPGVVAFEGAYHGLGYGALNATHREMFSKPFKAQLGRFGHFIPFPTGPTDTASLPMIEKAIHAIARQRDHRIGAILVEPVQARGGINVPPVEFLKLLRNLADEHKALLVVDEIYTGFGRTGKWFACEHSAVVSDLICLGKALTGGFPLSACVGRAELMDSAWPPTTGEAIHTSTFLGHPVGCAMALAQLEELAKGGLVERSAGTGLWLGKALGNLASNHQGVEARGIGLLAGLALKDPNGKPATALTLNIIKGMLRRGFIMLPEGEHGNVPSFSPPLTITRAQLQRALNALDAELSEAGS
jgi:4-aminobutyrate aminotransferase-like enzyme